MLVQIIWDGRVGAHEKGSFACVELAALHGRRPDVVSTSPRNGSSGCQLRLSVGTSYQHRMDVVFCLFTGLVVWPDVGSTSHERPLRTAALVTLPTGVFLALFLHVEWTSFQRCRATQLRHGQAAASPGDDSDVVWRSYQRPHGR